MKKSCFRGMNAWEKFVLVGLPNCFFVFCLPRRSLLLVVLRSLAQVSDHIDEVQTALGRQMLLENPSTYLAFTESTYSEMDFIREVVGRTGCGLLLDVNNVFVSSCNQQTSPFDYISAYPLNDVQEIHLGGHSQQYGDYGEPILIDTHDAPVNQRVWSLFQHTVRQTGPLPTLIEWDADVPEFSTLRAEAQRAEEILLAATLTETPYARAR
jgi:uncharacterized protein